MRLIKLYVSGYKNFDSIEIDFSKSNGRALIIGTNGTGKSNLLEVLSAIFSALYEGKKKVEPDFRFELEYIFQSFSFKRIDWRDIDFRGVAKINIQNLNGSIEVLIDGKKARSKKEIDSYLPPKTIAVYSGEEKRL